MHINMSAREGTTGYKAVENESSGSGIWTLISVLDLLDALPFYAMLVDKYHHILYANSKVRTHLGVEPKDIIGKYCPKVIRGLDGAFPGCPLEEAAETGEAVEREVLDPKTKRWLCQLFTRPRH